MALVALSLFLYVFGPSDCSRISGNLKEASELHFHVDIDTAGQTQVDRNLTAIGDADLFGLLSEVDVAAVSRATDNMLDPPALTAADVDALAESRLESKKTECADVRDAIEMAEKIKSGTMKDSHLGEFTNPYEQALFYLAFVAGWGQYEPNTMKQIVSDWGLKREVEKSEICRTWVNHIVANGIDGSGWDTVVYSQTPAGDWLKSKPQGDFGASVREAMKLAEEENVEDGERFQSADEKALFWLALKGWGATDPNDGTEIVTWLDLSQEQRLQLCHEWVRYIVSNGVGGPGFKWTPTAASIQRHSEHKIALEEAERNARLVWEIISDDREKYVRTTHNFSQAGKIYVRTIRTEGLYDPIKKEMSSANNNGPHCWKVFREEGEPSGWTYMPPKRVGQCRQTRRWKKVGDYAIG